MKWIKVCSFFFSLAMLSESAPPAGRLAFGNDAIASRDADDVCAIPFHLKECINKSSLDDPLWIIEAGEPDVIGYALEASEVAKRSYGSVDGDRQHQVHVIPVALLYGVDGDLLAISLRN